MQDVRLDEPQVQQRLGERPGWSLRDGAIATRYAFASFPDAIAFVTRLAFDAEASDHHPDLLVNYRRVTVSWSTHSAGGVTEKDFAGAAQSDRIAQAFGVHASQDELQRT
ncbi:MAG: 4a-hydroxytetrahydrobiopterin dehydratase [Acidobacteria bacterium]|nr:4a-hydroxytetrahydrobiopterin dehydratase [Acidobacteriota bacterium]